MKRIIIGFLIALFCTNLVVAQNLQEGQKRWSSEDKLTVDDFKIKIADEKSDVIFSQFAINYEIGGFDFFTKNLNQKVHNIFLGNASWIDTTKIETVDKQIEYQQSQFDIAEIYTRKFRKEVLKNKTEIIKGFEIVKQIDNKIMAGLSEERLKFIKETENGHNLTKLQEWREKIAFELEDLNEFRFENKTKIKISN